MSSLPGFLRGAPNAPIQTVSGRVNAGSIGLAIQPAPWRYTLLHERRSDLLLWITRGQGRVIVEGIRYGVSMHTVLFLPSGTQFSLDLPATLQGLYAESPTGLTDCLPDKAQILKIRDSLAQAEITGEIDQISREVQGARLRSVEALEARMRLVSVWLHRQSAQGTGTLHPGSASERLARRFADALRRGYRDPVNVAEYADRLDVTPTHLSRACKQSCGLTASEMLSQRRLHAARNALETGTDPVQSIARGLGFSSPAYFSRFIQKATGLSPTALRTGSGTARPSLSKN